MSTMSLSAYARAREVNPQTVHEAIKAGAIVPLPSGRLNVEETDAGWYAAHLARKQQVKASAPARAKALNAGAVATLAQISARQRQLRELSRSTAPQAVAEPARARRVARLLAALDALPEGSAREAAESLQRPPQAVFAALLHFVRQAAADIGDIIGQTSEP